MGVFVVSGGDAAEVLEASEHALDDVSAAIAFAVEGVGLLAVRPVGDDGLDPTALQPGPPMVGIVALVGQKVSGIRQMIGKHDRTGDVGGLAGC